MKKDVIYIDIEDDITAVIEKLKNAQEKIIALVPPKGNAVLQSVVNLKLLKRAADNAGKQPVIVTNNQALTALAGGLNLYIAKNLQSKPVLAGTFGEDIEDDEIQVGESDDLEVGSAVPLKASKDDSDEVELSSEELAALSADDAEAGAAAAKKPKSKGKKNKVPNFDGFKKKLLIGGGIALLLIVVLFAVFGRAKATIVVRAETTPVDVSFDANFNANSDNSDPETYNLKAQLQESKKTLNQSFAATGQKDIGEKASGVVRFSTGAISALGTTIPAGTQLRASNNLVYTTTQAVTITISNYSGANAGIAAAEPGSQFNGASGSMSGAPSSISANIVTSPSGGTSQVVRVVTQADVDKAKAQLQQQDSNAVREELKGNFGKDNTVFDDSFTAKLENIRSEPAVGEQANDARITAEATYTLLGVSNGDIGSALDAFVTSKMTNKDQQRVYDNGFSNMRFEKLEGGADRTVSYKVTATGQYGPQFDTDNLKEQIQGKKFGEARSYLQDLPGVKGIDMNLSPFWARKLPNPGRIQISLDVDKNNGN